MLISMADRREGQGAVNLFTINNFGYKSHIVFGSRWQKEVFAIFFTQNEERMPKFKEEMELIFLFERL